MVILLVLVASGFLYVVLNTGGSFTFREAKDFPNYNDLAAALLSGQLNLLYDVDPGRAAAAKPNDPALPYAFIPDNLIFQGKYYFVFQPLPSLIHAAWTICAHSSLPTGAVIVAAGMMNLILMLLLMEFIWRKWLPETPWWIVLLAWISFALSGVQIYIVSRPVVYHESIVVGVTFVLSGALFFARSLAAPNGSALNAFLSGVCFAAAFASKFTLVAYPVGFLFWRVASIGFSRRATVSLRSELICFCLPGLVGMGLLCAYNWARFGDLFDFGRAYLAMDRVDAYQYLCVQGKSFRLAHLPHNLYAYIASMPDLLFRHGLPWLRYRTELLVNDDLFMMRQNMASLFVIAPILILSLPRPGLFGFVKKSESLLTLVLACITSSLVAFGIFLFFFASVPRYAYEFTPLMFVAAYCSLAAEWARVQGNRRRELIWFLLVGSLLVAGALMGAYAGLNGMVWRAPE